MRKTQVFGFSTRYNNLSNVLINDCGIHSAVADPEQTNPNSLNPRIYKAIRDTGATNTCITEKVAVECGLPVIGTAEVHHANGKDTVDVFLASLYLPNGVATPVIRVNKAKLVNADILIGMDIIGQGDFAISNFKGITQFSFRMPSLMHMDLSKLDQGGKSGQKNRRRR